MTPAQIAAQQIAQQARDLYANTVHVHDDGTVSIGGEPMVQQAVQLPAVVADGADIASFQPDNPAQILAPQQFSDESSLRPYVVNPDRQSPLHPDANEEETQISRRSSRTYSDARSIVGSTARRKKARGKKATGKKAKGGKASRAQAQAPARKRTRKGRGKKTAAKKSGVASARRKKRKRQAR